VPTRRASQRRGSVSLNIERQRPGVAALRVRQNNRVGYDLHITRKKFWAYEEGPEITWDEWRAYVETDRELRFAPELGPRMVVMNIKSEYSDPWLDWSGGDVYTKNPDEPILAKMFHIAVALRAKLQGDDGEVFRSPNVKDYYYEPD
jgi:hypothetical protein